MIKVEEVNTITRNAWAARVKSGEEKAEEVMPIIEEQIIQAAQDGFYHTTLHIFNMNGYEYNSLEEKNAYLTRIESVLKESGFQVQFNPSGFSLFVRWM